MRFVSPLALALVATAGLACAHHHKVEAGGDKEVVEATSTGGSATAGARRVASVHFDLNKSTITASDRAMLDQLASALLANESVGIAIVGNTDETGTDEHNLKLGQERADAAKAYLVQRGVAPERIGTVSAGENQAKGGEGANPAERRGDVIVK